MKGSEARARQFLDLLAPIQEALQRYALRNSWNREQAGDILQEAVLTGWREFHRFQIGTDFRAWMFKVLVNTVYSFNKKVTREKQQRTTFADDLEGVLQREEAWFGILANPEQVLQGLDQRLVGAIGTLGLDERHCLLLRIVEGFAYKDIATMLDIPMGTVMSHVHRARLKLRERLAELAVEHGLVKEVSNEVQ